MDDTLKDEYHCREHVAKGQFSDYCLICYKQKAAGKDKPSCHD